MSRDKLGTLGACEVVATALSTYQSTITLVEASSQAICALCQSSEKNRKLFSLYNTMDILVHILQREINSEETSSVICRAISVLCFLKNAENQEKCGSVGACEMVTLVLIRYRDGPTDKIKVDALQCISTLAAQYPPNQNRCVTAARTTVSFLYIT